MRIHALLTALGLAAVLLGAGPARALIINVDASAHIAGAPLEVMLEAGSYRATLLDGASDADPTTQYTAWSFAFGDPETWGTAYWVTLEDDTAFNGGGFANADSAAEAFAQTNNLVLDFDVPTEQTVRFRVADNVGFDNPGGVSLDLVAVPEPSVFALLLAAAGLGGRGRSFGTPSRR